MDTLPPEIKKLIRSNLDYRSRRAMRQASLHWFNIIQYDDFSFYFTTEEQVPQILQRLATYKYPIGVSFEKPMCQIPDNYYEDIGTLTQLTKLLFSSNVPDPEHVLDPLTNLTNLRRVDHNLPKRIIKHLTNLHQLYLKSTEEAHNLDLDRYKNLRGVTWSLRANDYKSLTEDFLLIPCTKDIHYLYMHINEEQTVDINNLTRFTKLEDLYLFYNEPRSVDLPYLPNLETLYANANEINGFEQLPKLTDLTTYAKPESFANLTALTKLRSLAIIMADDCTADDLSFLTALTNLESFDFSEDKDDLHRGLQYLSSTKLTRLEYPSLKIDHATKFGKLEYLVLEFCEALVLEHLPNLTYLQIGNVVRDDIPFIEKLTNLKSLQLDFVKNVTDNSHDTFQLGQFSVLTKLRVNMLGAINKKETLVVNGIENLSLVQLDIGGMDNSFLEKISKMTTLQSLNIWASITPLDDTSLLYLTNLTNLRYLWITHAQNITGDSLTRLTFLRELAIGKLIEEKELKKKLTRLYNLYCRT